MCLQLIHAHDFYCCQAQPIVSSSWLRLAFFPAFPHPASQPATQPASHPASRVPTLILSILCGVPTLIVPLSTRYVRCPPLPVYVFSHPNCFPHKKVCAVSPPPNLRVFCAVSPPPQCGYAPLPNSALPWILKYADLEILLGNRN